MRKPSATRRKRVVGHLLLFLAFLSVASACAVLPWWASANKRGDNNKTTASLKLGPDAVQDGMFIGLAISGGGSRAANFGAAVMLELQELGVLQKVDVIASVSGGSIAAAYYALQGSRGISFDRRQVDEAFARDFQARWITRWFAPWNALRYWFTAFDRSDIMVQVFEANLFHGATFAELGQHLPRQQAVLLNASNFVNGRKFVFSNESFDLIDSDLAQYHVARAVMASGAFPAAFANVTLRDHRPGPTRYKHLFDGGAIDNLGVGTVIKVLQKHVVDSQGPGSPGAPSDLLRKVGFPKGCLVISVDAYTRGAKKGEDLADTRPWYGFLVDTNVMEAMDDLLAVKRNEVLHEMGLDNENDEALGSFPLFRLNLDDDEIKNYRRELLKSVGLGPRERPGQPGRYVLEQALDEAGYCHVWHIAISQVPRGGCALGRRINDIGTWYRIDKEDQCALFKAARVLVRAMWNDPDFRLPEWLRNGFPTAAPIPNAPVAVEHLRTPGNCDEPTADEATGFCPINLPAVGGQGK